MPLQTVIIVAISLSIFALSFLLIRRELQKRQESDRTGQAIPSSDSKRTILKFLLLFYLVIPVAIVLILWALRALSRV